MSTAERTNSPMSIVLLDTNVLHYLDLYAKRAKQFGWYPFGTSDATPSPYKRLNEDLKKGKAVMRYICDNHVQVQYSPVSELELLTGRLRGRALVKAANEGIPDRMWSNFRESEVSARLLVDDFDEIYRGIDSLVEILAEPEIETVVSYVERMSEVWRMARGVARLVFLETRDCLIYATALVVGAEYLVTSDSYFRTTVNSIRNSHRKGNGAKVRTLVKDILPIDTVPVLPEAKQPLELANL